MRKHHCLLILLSIIFGCAGIDEGVLRQIEYGRSQILNYRDAMESFRSKTGEYPDSLPALVREGYLVPNRN